MNEKESFAGVFRRIQPKFSRLFSRILTEAGLTLPQYALLNQLLDTGPVPMTGLAVKLHITKPAVTHLVDRLEKKQCLRRLPHPKDRRVSLLAIQPKGEKIVREMQTFILNFLLKTLDRFSTGEKKTISRFYARLSQTLDEVLAKQK